MSSFFIVTVSVIVLLLLIFSVWVFVRGEFITGLKKNSDRACLVKAYYFLIRGMDDNALAEFKRVTLEGHSSPEVYLMMAVLYRRKGELLKAIHLNEGLMLKGELDKTATAIVLRELAKCYRAADTLDKAEEWLAKMPDNVADPEIILIRADLYSHKKDHENAIRKYQQYTKRTGNSTDAEIAREYVSIARQCEDNTPRIKALQNAVKYDADNIDVYYELSDLHFFQNKISQGMRDINVIISRDLIRSKEDLKRVEEVYFQYSNLDELERLMGEKVLAHSDAPAPYLYLSESHVKKGSPEKAVQLLKDYIAEHGSKAIIVKTYAKLSDDPVLLKIAQIEDIYRCTVCNAKYKTYISVCTKCGRLHSLDYI